MSHSTVPNTPLFRERMLDKTLRRGDIELKRGQNYNYPLRWYATPNGDIVQLQADPESRALYTDLGFHLLADQAARGQDLSEVEEWERIERPKVIAEQRRRAALINAIRRADQQNPTLMLNMDTIDDDPTDELEEMITSIKAQGQKVRVVDTTPKRGDAPEPQLRGVETAATNSLEDLQRKLDDPAAQARTIEARRPRP